MFGHLKQIPRSGKYVFQDSYANDPRAEKVLLTSGTFYEENGLPKVNSLLLTCLNSFSFLN